MSTEGWQVAPERIGKLASDIGAAVHACPQEYRDAEPSRSDGQFSEGLIGDGWYGARSDYHCDGSYYMFAMCLGGFYSQGKVSKIKNLA